MYPYGMIKDRDVASVYGAMIRRCYDNKNDNYSSYGGRGITVCGMWLDHPEAFEEWTKVNGYRKG